MKTLGIISMAVLLSASTFGCDSAHSKGAAGDPAAPAATAHAHGAHTVAITVDDKGFTPNRVEVKKGEKTTLRFTRTSDATCATKVVFPEIEVEKELVLNKPVDVQVPTDTARTLAFKCGMGMFESSVVIN